MVLLHLAGRQHTLRRKLRVATFDHGTGVAATEACQLVSQTAELLGIPVETGRSDQPGRTEASWRNQRWHFLRGVARSFDATIATAHHRDDHLETVVHRTLRGAGARGLAGLLTDTPGVQRPLLHTRRSALQQMAVEGRLRWVEDPTNTSGDFLRNRIRHDLLPALVAARPSFESEMLALSERAADLRADLEALAATFVDLDDEGRLVIDGGKLDGLAPEHRALVWPALLGPRGVVLDRRGILRLTSWSAAKGGTIPLSGGWRVSSHRGRIVVSRARAIPDASVELPADGEVRFGEWVFRSQPLAVTEPPAGRWTARFPSDVEAAVRSWRDGDRLAREKQLSRRVKRFLVEAGIPRGERRGWPVVVTGGEIVWVPGASRYDAAPDRSGRPMRLITCERFGS